MKKIRLQHIFICLQCESVYTTKLDAAICCHPDDSYMCPHCETRFSSPKTIHTEEQCIAIQDSR